MRICICILLLCCFSFVADGQYYYNDVIATKETNTIYAGLTSNKITQVSAVSMRYDNAPDDDFYYRKKIQNNGAVIVTESKIAAGNKSVSTASYANGRIKKIVDSSDKVLTTTTYNYSENGNLSSINMETDDDFMNSHLEEQHIWHYDEKNNPDYLLLIKNKTDTTQVTFIKDENGNIGEERWLKRGNRIETYYYYYDAHHQITDIVRFNPKAQRMLPDFLFEYNEAGIVIQVIQVSQGSSDYTVWQYIYGADGLKQKDILRNKQKELLGRIEYSYK